MIVQSLSNDSTIVLNEARQRIDSIKKRSSERDLSLRKLERKSSSKKFLFAGIEQAREDQVFENMSVHDLNVRWLNKDDKVNDRL